MTIAILLLAVSIASLSVSRVYGPPGGETYILIVSSPRSQEVNTPGETLFLNISNAAIGSNYHVSFTVTDPNGIAKSASNTTTASTTSIILSVVYPRDFPAGTTIHLVGNYTINVSQSQPQNKASVATGSFLIGLTDAKAYQRTTHISIRASGYGASENITTTLMQGGTSAIGFPTWLLADSNGNLNYSWRVPPNEPTGSYTLTLTGLTSKPVPDSQTLSVLVTSVNVPGLTAKWPNISRSLTEQLLLGPQYPDGQRVQSGLGSIRITETDGIDVENATAGYDNLTGLFRCPYYVPKTAMAGIWIARVDPNTFDDGYGNRGPALTVTTGFNVQPATLNVSIINISVGIKTYIPGDIIPIYASVSYPDGSSLSSGTVQARLTKGGIPVGTPVTLAYIPGQQAWAGTYQVGNNDPSGLWLITIDATNQIGDTGEGTYSATVDVPPATSTSWFTTSNFLLIVAIIAGAFLALLVWALFAARRKVTRKQMKIDLSVVDKEVSKIQDSAFFQNVKKQVDEKSKDSSAKDTKTDKQ